MSAVLPCADEGIVRSGVGERREGGRRESLELSPDTEGEYFRVSHMSNNIAVGRGTSANT